MTAQSRRGLQFIRVALGLAGAAAAALPARADAPLVPGGLAALRRSASYQTAVVAGAQRSGAWVVHPCADAKPTFGDRLGIGTPPSFDAQGRALAGAWIEHVTFDGCGETRLLNVLVVARGAGQLATVPLLPGTSRANPLLQRDGAGYAFIAAGVARDGCKPIYIVDTAFLGYAAGPSGVPGKPAWSERWTVAQCDKRSPVVLRFIPDAHGTAIVVDHIDRAP